MNACLDVMPEVADALAAGQPVVALESTIIAHGMPYPRNLETARQVEAAVRAHGAVPATIAVADGRIRVGLDEAMLERLALEPGVLKLSRRDLASALARRHLGATTVAATMIGAHLAGIGIFATGGIGGVHHGAAATFDVSADLEELARTPVTVVCAGAKSILDLPLTLEYLETRGVPVIGYRTNELPAFYCRTSGLELPLRCDSAGEIARLMRAQRQLGLTTGIVVANPIAKEHEIAEAEIGSAIDAALAVARDRAIGGKEVTPFLLAEVAARTGGRSLAANIALVLSNAALAADTAVALGRETLTR